jgi:hypothetical protein
MKIVKKLVKENAVGNRLEAIIMQRDNGLSVKYYVNNNYKHEEVFLGKELPFVESVANGWLSEVKDLHG